MSTADVVIVVCTLDATSTVDSADDVGVTGNVCAADAVADAETSSPELAVITAELPLEVVTICCSAVLVSAADNGGPNSFDEVSVNDDFPDTKLPEAGADEFGTEGIPDTAIPDCNGVVDSGVGRTLDKAV